MPLPSPVVKALLAAVVYAAVPVILLAGCASGKTQAEKDPIPDYVDVEIMYATDRNVEDRSRLDKFYGGQRGQMSYGVSTVAIRTSESKTGFADTSQWRPSTHQTGKRAKLVRVEEMELPSFLSTLADRIDATSERSAIVYTHGYARKFERAARTMAMLVYETSYQGIPVLYSWPSRGTVTAYPGDVTTVDWAEPHFREFLKLLAAQHDLDVIHVVVHSLGNRAFLKSLMHLLDDEELTAEWRFGEIVLLAPDVDRDIFVRDIAPVITSAPSRITLYVSSVDVPLKASKSINLYPRVGDASSEPVIVDGIDTIDASDVANLVTGHSYYRDTPEAIEDMYYLLKMRLGPEGRPTLEAVDSEDGRYWRIKN